MAFRFVFFFFVFLRSVYLYLFIHNLQTTILFFCPELQDCLHQPEIKLESLKDDVRNFLKTSGGRIILIPTENIGTYTCLCFSLFMTAFFSLIGWERQLQNAVYRELHM